MADQLFTCVYRPEFGDDYAIAVEVTHPLDPRQMLELRFHFAALDELLTLLMAAELERGLSREVTYAIYDNAELALIRKLCDVSYDDERDFA